MEQDGNTQVAEFIQQLDWDDLPEPVKQTARLSLLDALGMALGGIHSPASQVAAGIAASLWCGDQATLWLHGQRTRAAGAAFANGCAAEAVPGEIETRSAARGPSKKWVGGLVQNPLFRPGTAPARLVVPAALAVAEAVHASGRALLEALVIGCEVGQRARRCWQAEQPFEQGCGAWGSLACAAAAARLLGLDRVQIQHALGIADYHAPNAPLQDESQPAPMTGQAAGWGAMNGVMSAELAQRGFTGIPSLLGFAAYREWVMDIGQRYWMADSSLADISLTQVEPRAGRWGPAGVEDRFRWLAGRALPPENIEPVIGLVQQFEALESVQPLTRLLA